MARKKSNTYKKPSKIEPAVQTLTFSVPGVAPSVNQSFFIDLSQCASLVNRRFYRQGINWAVAGFKFGTAGPSKASIIISKLPNTWILSNSWEKSMRTWNRMNTEALAETESIRPRFLDFKIYADADHHAQGFGANLLPVNLLTAPATAGEWAPSSIHVPQTDDVVADTRIVNEYELIAVGPSYPGLGASGNNAVSMIEGYASSRGLPNIADPNTPDDARNTTAEFPQNWMSAIFNDGLVQDSDVLRDMQLDNNIAPYPFENDGVNLDTMYPGGANQLPGVQVHSWDLVTPTTIGSTTYSKGGNFPCGLIRIDITNQDPALPESQDLTAVFQIDLVPGNHRGYLCEPMTEM